MTEVYNLIKIGRINNHLVIPGNEKAALSNPWTRPLEPQQPSMKPEIVPILDHRFPEVWDIRDLGHLGTSLGGGSGGSILVNSRVDSEVILGPILDLI